MTPSFFSEAALRSDAGSLVNAVRSAITDYLDGEVSLNDFNIQLTSLVAALKRYDPQGENLMVEGLDLSLTQYPVDHQALVKFRSRLISMLREPSIFQTPSVLSFTGAADRRKNVGVKRNAA